MEIAEIDKILREIRIEWEDIFRTKYNPLQLAISLTKPQSQITISYRNTYHKLERAMQKVIDLSFHGFTDSVLSYKKIHSLNNEVIEILTEMKKKIFTIKSSLSVDLNSLKKEKSEIEVYRNMLDILQKILEMNNLIENQDKENLISASYNILRCFTLYNELKDIKVVKYLLENITKKKEIIIESICDRISGFIFENEDQGLTEVKCIFILDVFELADSKMIKRMSEAIFKNIESIISKVGANDFKITEIDPKFKYLYRNGDFKIHVLARKLTSYFKFIIKHYDKVLKKIDFYQLKKTNFFEQNLEEIIFFKRDSFMEILKKEIFKLINVYSTKKTKDHDCSFSLQKVDENINYDKIFGSTSYIKNKLSENTKYTQKNFKTEYSIIFEANYDFVYFLYENIFDEVKEDIRKLLLENFFKYKNVKNNHKMDLIFESKTFFLVENEKLCIFDKIRSLILQNSIYEVEFSYESFVKIITKIIEAFTIESKNLFKAKIVFEALDENLYTNDFENEICIGKNKDTVNISKKYLSNFKELLLKRSVSCEETLSKAISYRKCMFTVKTVNDLIELLLEEKCKYEKVEKNIELEKLFNDLSSLEIKYACLFQLQVTVDIFYNFDLFYRQGQFKKNDNSLQKIVDIFKALDEVKIGKFINFFEIMDVLKYYCIANLENLNVRSEKDLESFIEDLKMLEEITLNFEMEYNIGLEDYIIFLQDVLENKLDTASKEKLYKKIH